MNNFAQQMMKNRMRRNSEREARLEVIRQKCIEAGVSLIETFEGEERPIHLADVLLAIDKKGDEHHLTSEGQFALYDPEDGNMYLSKVWWNLRKDDLTEQSDECITFLADLLNEKPLNIRSWQARQHRPQQEAHAG